MFNTDILFISYTGKEVTEKELQHSCKIKHTQLGGLATLSENQSQVCERTDFKLMMPLLMMFQF